MVADFGKSEGSDPAIRVDHLVKRYRTGSASKGGLGGMSFALWPGECLALLGPNGAGRTTTIEILATLLKADAGQARIEGFDVGDEANQVRARLGVVLQETSVPRRQTARRLLAYHACLYGLDGAAAGAAVEELVEALDLGAIVDQPLGRCSGGERRRVDVALALVHRPPVILLDEPSAGLDLASRRLIWRQLQLRRAAGAALLFSTHDLDEAETQAARVAVVHGGTLVADSTPRELKRQSGPRAVKVSFGTRSRAEIGARALDLSPPNEGPSLVIDVERDEDVVGVLERLARHGVETEAISVTEPALETVVERMIAGIEPNPGTSRERQ